VYHRMRVPLLILLILPFMCVYVCVCAVFILAHSHFVNNQLHAMRCVCNMLVLCDLEGEGRVYRSCKRDKEER